MHTSPTVARITALPMRLAGVRPPPAVYSMQLTPPVGSKLPLISPNRSLPQQAAQQQPAAADVAHAPSTHLDSQDRWRTRPSPARAAQLTGASLQGLSVAASPGAVRMCDHGHDRHGTHAARTPDPRAFQPIALQPSCALRVWRRRSYSAMYWAAGPDQECERAMPLRIRRCQAVGSRCRSIAR